MIKHIIDTTQKIMEGSLPYQAFTKELSQTTDYKEDEKQIIRTLVNGLLNRYYRYFYSLTAGIETKLTTLEILALSLYSFNLEKNVMKMSYEEFVSALPTDVQIKLERDYPPTSFPIKIPAFDRTEQLALSYAARFSAPLSLIEQLINDIGKKNILKFLSKRPQELTGLVNESLVTSEAFFAAAKDFIKGDKPNQFIYQGSDFIKKTTIYGENKIILASQSLLDIADVICDLNPKTMLFVQHEDTSLILLLSLLYPAMSIHFTANDPKSKFIIQHLIRKFNLKNVAYITNIAQTYDFVFTTLSNSNVNGNIRHRDFYFRLPAQLGAFADTAKGELNAVKDYVNQEGCLVFTVTTALRAETHYQALSFIHENPEFILEREKQFYHFNELHETVYYALFKKGSHDK